MKVYVYSSASRSAQHDFFKYSQHGDLRDFISGYFDTTSGHKRDAKSYGNIFQSLGFDSPSQVYFLTDVLEEAKAADEAGFVR